MPKPSLVTGAAGRVGAVGRSVTDLLLRHGHAVRAMVRHEDKRAQALRDMGADVVVGDPLDLDSMHRAIAGCETMYFGMSVSDAYLAATVNAAAAAKHHSVKAFINMSQMTVSQMRITDTTACSHHKLHWLAEQALIWSGLPVVHVRPTVLLDGFFLLFSSESVKQSHQNRLPFGEGKTSPIATDDVAPVVAALLTNPQPHIGRIYHLTGWQSENMQFYAQEYSKALGRTITYEDIPVESWRQGLLKRGFPFIWWTTSRRWPICIAPDATTECRTTCPRPRDKRRRVSTGSSGNMRRHSPRRRRNGTSQIWSHPQQRRGSISGHVPTGSHGALHEEQGITGVTAGG